MGGSSSRAAPPRSQGEGVCEARLEKARKGFVLSGPAHAPSSLRLPGYTRDHLKGHNSSNHVDGTIITGNYNTVFGSDNIVEGNCNKVFGHGNFIRGNANKVEGTRNTVRGNGNKLFGLANLSASGSGNKVDQAYRTPEKVPPDPKAQEQAPPTSVPVAQLEVPVVMGEEVVPVGEPLEQCKGEAVGGWHTK